MRYERSRILFGEDFGKLASAKVLLLGVGGVGSFCLDCLIRSGIRDVTIVDFDTFDETNLNRQMWSEEHIGQSKVQALKTHYPEISVIETRIDPDWVATFDFTPYDLILDAIDDTRAKLALAQTCHAKLISATGSAKRIDPSKIEVGTIWTTHGDRFAAKLRYELKKRGFKQKYPVIFSSEPPRVKVKGSFMGVTASFGLMMCSLAVQRIIAPK